MRSSPTDDRTDADTTRREVGTMPQMGVSVAEGTIVEWRKRPGDWVEADEPVCDVTTDKIDVEIPRRRAGAWSGSWSSRGPRSPWARRSRRSTPAPGPARPTPTSDNGRGSAAAQARGPAPTEGDGDRSRFYSPVVRRIADKHGVDLAQVSGTGIGGRVRKKDVLAYIEAREGVPAGLRSPPSTSSPRTDPRGGAPPTRPARQPAASAGAPPPSGRGAGARPARADVAHAPGDRAPHDRQPAHGRALHDDRRGRFLAGRRAAAELREPMGRRGVNLTYLAFVALATVEALRSTRGSTRRSTARRSSTTTTSTSGSRSRSTTAWSCR